MGHYDHPLPMTYTFPALAFGGASSSSSIKPPRGLSLGVIRDIHAMVTVLFTAVTTPAFVRLGYSGDTDYYAELNMGTAPASAGYNSSDIASSTTVIHRRIDLNNDPVPGDLSAVLVSFVAATGGTPAGTATVAIAIGWW